ncbi:uncharacterized protein PG998_010439, partial [Apiospora kogelbergensis]|uniref:uncharacterized protein n=1 Tax=Apiospora kogelbergensis TaxID=1337665 RepID=UPI00312F8A4F
PTPLLRSCQTATMASDSPIPVLLCGKIPGHIKATTEIMKPEFEGKYHRDLFQHRSGPHRRIPHALPIRGDDRRAEAARRLDGRRVHPRGLPVRPRRRRGRQVGPLGPARHDEARGRGRGGRCAGAALGRGGRGPAAEDVGGALGELREGKGQGEIWWM